MTQKQKADKLASVFFKIQEYISSELSGVAFEVSSDLAINYDEENNKKTTSGSRFKFEVAAKL